MDTLQIFDPIDLTDQGEATPADAARITRGPTGKRHEYSYSFKVSCLLTLKMLGWPDNPTISIAELARRLGVEHTTLYRWWVNRERYLVDNTEGAARIRETLQEELISRIKALQNDVLRHITPEKLEKASARDLIISYGILQDKAALLQGESPQQITILHKLDRGDTLSAPVWDGEAIPVTGGDEE